MSGSPVYIDGRLIGAVSYALGAFSKEPIAGITPIAEMTDSVTLAGVRPPGAKIQIDLPLTRENLTAALRKALNWNRPFAEGSQGAAAARCECRGRTRRRATRRAAAPHRDTARDVGLRAGGRGSLRHRVRQPGLRPHRRQRRRSAGRRDAVRRSAEGRATPIGVMLVNGDLQMGGTGTVTHIDDDRVYAFGHPLYNLGPTEFPMTRAYVYTVLPSLLSSFKLSTTGEVIGTFLQDRATTIAGRLGPGPRMIPVTVNLTQARGVRTHLQLRGRQRPVVHAADDLRGAVEHAELVRAPVRRGHVQRPRAGDGEGPRSDRVRRSLLDQPVRDGRVGVYRRAAHLPSGQRLREGRGQRPRADDRLDRGTEDGDARARVDRRSAAARRPHRSAEDSAPHLPGRGRGAHAPRSDPGQRQRHALGDGDRRLASRPDGAARSAHPAAAAQRRSGDQVAQQGASQQHALRQAARRRGRRGRRTARCCPRCRRRCWPCSKPIGTAAPSTRCAARPSANGSSRPSTPSAGRARCRSPFPPTDREIVMSYPGGCRRSRPSSR